MESEKVKEILKKRIENINPWETHALEYHKGLLDLINELERENERLKWEKQTLEDKDTLLAKVGEINQENERLKNCIAELEKENKTKTDTISNLLKKQEFYEKEKLTKLAESLKGKAIRRQEFIGELAIDDVVYVKVKDIDETLQEELKNG